MLYDELVDLWGEEKIRSFNDKYLKILRQKDPYKTLPQKLALASVALTLQTFLNSLANYPSDVLLLDVNHLTAPLRLRCYFQFCTSCPLYFVYPRLRPVGKYGRTCYRDLLRHRAIHHVPAGALLPVALVREVYGKIIDRLVKGTTKAPPVTPNDISEAADLFV